MKFAKEVDLSSRRLKTFEKLFSFKIVRGDEDYSAADQFLNITSVEVKI